MLTASGEQQRAAEVSAVLSAGDLDHDGEISFGEFLNLVLKMRHGKTNFSDEVICALIQNSKHEDCVAAGSEMLSQESVEALLRSVSGFMGSDPLCSQYIPLSVADLTSQLRDGVFLCRLAVGVDAALIR